MSLIVQYILPDYGVPFHEEWVKVSVLVQYSQITAFHLLGYAVRGMKVRVE